MSDEVTTHQVEGFCDGIMLKGGDWQEFHINIGRQYPVKLASKQKDIQEAVAAAGRNPAVWTYSERDGNPNPHRPGEFYKNRYLEKVEVGGTPDPALAAQQKKTEATAGTTGQQVFLSDDGRGQSIERQVIVKAVLANLALTGDSFDEEKLFGLLDRLDDWMGRQRATTTVAATAAETAAPAGNIPDDDDIPF